MASAKVMVALLLYLMEGMVERLLNDGLQETDYRLLTQVASSSTWLILKILSKNKIWT